MGKALINHIRKKFVEAFPDKFSSLEDLPISRMYKILEEKGISKAEYILIGTAARFDFTIQTSGVKLEGLVLDLCSADISIASIYDKDKVVCYEFMTEFVEGLNRKNIKVVQANIRDQSFYGEEKRFFPFKDNSFDYLYCEGFPLRPCSDKNVFRSVEKIDGQKEYIKNVVEEMIRVTKNKAIICSIPLMRNFPIEYLERMENIHSEESIFVLDCRKEYKNKKAKKKDELRKVRA